MKYKAFKYGKSTWLIKCKKYWLFPWALLYINDELAKFGSNKKANEFIKKLES